MKKFVLAVGLLLLCVPAFAHVIAYELDAEMTGGQVFWNYLLIGFQHIIPWGIDHILFILCVFFLNTDLKKIVWQASMFTLAHSITLGLAMYGVIDPPAGIVEPLIAASIVLLAIENIYSSKVKPWRMGMVFLFGLIHGMGFAGALSDFGLPQDAFATALVAFNVGVELGQLAIIAFMYVCVAMLFSSKTWYRKRLVVPASFAIALVAAYWTVERLYPLVNPTL